MDSAARANPHFAPSSLLLRGEEGDRPVNAERLLELLQSGELPLTAVISTNGLDDRLAYQTETVRPWLNAHLAALTPTSQFEGGQDSAKDWYILRGTEIFGPLTAGEVIALRTNQSLMGQDVCWNFPRSQKVRAIDVPAGDLTNDEIDSHCQRTRARVTFAASVILRVASANITGLGLDLSTEGLGVLTKIPLGIGTRLEVELATPAAAGPLVLHATVASFASQGSSYRLGLRFGRLGREERDALRKRMITDEN